METFPFVLVKDVVADAKRDYIARIKPGIRDKEGLLREIGAKLRFPYWQSPNWDGFNDWISDLSWIPQKRIVMLHEGVPAVSRKDLLTYIEILLDAVDVLREDQRTLPIAFPEQTRALSDALSGVKR